MRLPEERARPKPLEDLGLLCLLEPKAAQSRMDERESCSGDAEGYHELVAKGKPGDQASVLRHPG